MKTLLDFIPEEKKEVEELTLQDAEILAQTKYKDDENIQFILHLLRYGTKDIKTKDGKIEGMPPNTEYAQKLLVKAIKIREKGIVGIKNKEKTRRN